MKLGLLFQDKGFQDMDLSEPYKGNPGIGGTEYMYLVLAYYLKMMYSDIDIYFVHYNKNKFPVGCKSIIVSSTNDIFQKCLKNNIFILIHDTEKTQSFYNMAVRYDINLIVWASCYLSYPETVLAAECTAVKKVVFVGKQEYDRYIDHEIIKKSCYIYNMFKRKKCNIKDVNSKQNIVTYMGSLIPAKGFHVIAKEWKKILKIVPDAKLVVIGTGKLYSRKEKLGKFGIAAPEYENSFIKYLLDENGNIHSSVIFKGVMGSEKIGVFSNTKVGIVNPTAKTETFCISAVEMEAMGIPVVTKRSLGLCDTVKNKMTGLTFKNEKDIVDCVTKLLLNNELNSKYGRNAVKFVDHNFKPKKIAQQWYDLINNLDIESPYLKPENYYFNDLKWLRIINRKIRSIIGYSHTKSIDGMIFLLKKLLK